MPTISKGFAKEKNSWVQFGRDGKILLRTYLTLATAETVAALHNSFAPALIVDHRVRLTVSYGRKW